MQIAVHQTDYDTVSGALAVVNQLGKYHSNFGGWFCSDRDYRFFIRTGGDRLIQFWVSQSEYEAGSFRYGSNQGLFDILNYYGSDTSKLMRRFGKIIEIRPGKIYFESK